MDRILRAEIVAEVRRTMTEALEIANERWLTADELCQQFQMFTKDWLRRYGHSLTRRRAIVKDEQGVEHKTGWVYPMHEINRMIHNGEIEHLRCLSVKVTNNNNINLKKENYERAY